MKTSTIAGTLTLLLLTTSTLDANSRAKHKNRARVERNFNNKEYFYVNYTSRDLWQIHRMSNRWKTINLGSVNIDEDVESANIYVNFEDDIRTRKLMHNDRSVLNIASPNIFNPMVLKELNIAVNAKKILARN